MSNIDDIVFAFGVMGKMEYELADGTVYLCEEIDEEYKISYIITMHNCKVVFATATDKDLKTAVSKVHDFVMRATVKTEVL